MLRLRVHLGILIAVGMCMLLCCGCKDGDKTIIIPVAPPQYLLPGMATNPIPTDGAIDVPVDQILSWTAATTTDTYNVYFGTDVFAVADANTGSAEFMGNQPGLTYDPPGDLAFGTTYYWRIDPVNTYGTTKGNIWLFTVVDQNLPPWFSGAKSIAAAGASAIRLSWDAATDDYDDSSLIIYEVFGATTSGGQNFTTPTVTTPAGWDGVVVANTDFPGIAAGAEVFFVVRAVDTQGNSDSNTVEVSLTLPAATDVFYVDDSVAGPGTGTFADPFASVQDGINAAETAGGGTILVSEGSYNEKLDFTVTATTPISMLGGFPDWSTFTGTPTEIEILAARNTKTQESVILGSGLTYATPQEGLIDIFNDRRPTLIDGFTVMESEDVSILGQDVDLKISGCLLTDVDDTTEPTKGIDLDTSAPNIFNNFEVIGTEISYHQYGIEFGGGTEKAIFSGNYIHDTSSNSIRSSTDYATMLDSDSIVVRAFGTCNIRFEANKTFRTQNGIFLDFEPEAPATAGTLNLTFLNNEFLFVHSGNAVDIEDLAFFGNGGSGKLTVTGNYFLGISSDAMEIDFLDTTTIDATADGNIDLYFSGNQLIHTNSDGFEIRRICVAPAGLTKILMENNYFTHFESEAIEMDWESETGAGTIEVVVTSNEFYNGDTNVDVEPRSVPGGVSYVYIFNNMFTTSLYDCVEFDDYSTTTNAGEVNFFLGYNRIVGSHEGGETRIQTGVYTLGLICRNEIGLCDVDSSEGIRFTRYAEQSSGSWVIRNNAICYNAGEGIDAETGCYPHIVNNTLFGNGRESSSRPGIHGGSDTSYSQLHIANCIVSENSGGDLQDDPLSRAIYSLIGDQDPPAGLGNITGDPIFVTCFDIQDYNEFFRLALHSPAIDVGNPASYLNDPDGSRNDMGAFGGPGAGQIGYIRPNAPIPMLVMGLRPFSHLYTGARLLDPASDIRVVFTNAVDAATVDATSISVTSGGSPVAGTFATDGREVTFSPTSPLTPGSVVAVTVTTALQDTDGQSNEFSWYLDTAVEVATTLESETNDTTATANALPGDVFRMVGTLDSGGADATDLYSFSAGVGDRLMATIFAERGAISTGDFQLTLLDSDGTTIITMDDNSFGDPVVVNNYDPYIDYTFTAAGTYYLLVQEINAAGAEGYELEGWLKK